MEQAIARTSRMPIWAGVILGALVGLAGGAHLIVAMPLGFVLGYVLYARDRALSDNKQLHARIGGLLERVSLLEYSVKNLRRDAPAVHDAVPEAPLDVAPETPVVPTVEAPPLAAKKSEVSLDVPWVTEPRKPAAGAPGATSPAAARPSVASSKSAAPSLIDNAIAAVRSWFFGGNTVARVGLLVLFVGVAFLLRYVAERTHVPIELRLVGVALGALALLVVGWRLRHKRAGYAITLQGGAIGILYLTVFAALRLYDVLP
ncbi:MAG: DUF2339 domain-containing protein, partial [Burkholderiaceae bacterium]